MPPKKTVIVVKTLRDLSPKKQIMVSRKANDDEAAADLLQPTRIGNSSPQKAEKGKDGTFLPRSILGDPAIFDHLERKRRAGSASAAERQPTTGRRGLSRETKRATSPPKAAHPAPEDDIEIDQTDIANNPRLFIETLKKQYQKAEQIRKKNQQQESMLLTYIPVNERFNLNKEGKVLTQWQERQKDWEKIQADISKRISVSANHSLMMTKTDDFRIKNEQYDLIQAAIPIEDRFGPNIWVKTLRGTAPRSVPVGHVFSGLFCAVDLPIPPPSLIRKPRTVSFGGTLKQTKAFDETLPLTMKRDALSARIGTMRPREVTQEDADGLIVKATSLFQWAIESSQDHFNSIETRRSNDSIRLQDTVAAQARKFALAADAAAAAAAAMDAKQALLELDGSDEVVFSALMGETAYRSITFKNTGTIAVAYSWAPILYKDGLETANLTEQVYGSQVSHILYDRTPSRESQLSSVRPAFFCLNASGTVLPGQTISTTFSFCSKGLPGTLRQPWRLKTVPNSSFTIHSKPLGRSYTSMVLEIKMHGQAISYTMDEHDRRRDSVASFISAKAVDTMMEDEVRQCLRRVRKPVRVRDIEERQVEIFTSRNAEIFQNLSKMFGKELPLFVTPDRLHLFSLVCVHITHFNVSILREVFGLRRLRHTLESTEFDAEYFPQEISEAAEEEAVRAAAQLNIGVHALATLKAELFPEKLIEIYDEITDLVITPSWDFDLASLIRSIKESVERSKEIEELEIIIDKRKTVLQKARAREERRLARLALKDADDDDEDEDEEEDEPDAEDAPPRQKHKLTIEAESHLAKCISTVHLLTTKPLSIESSAVEAAVGDVLGRATEGFHQWSEEAKAANSLTPADVITVLPSPFTSAEGAAAWQNILVPKPVEVPTGKGGKAAKPPAKGKGAGASPEQIEGYYLQMHEKIKEGLLDVALDVCDKIDTSLAHATATRIVAGGRGEKLSDVATIRDEDAVEAEGSVNGRVAFVSFDGTPFHASTLRSAFDVAKIAQKNALRPVQRLAQNGAKVIVLVYENQRNQPPVEGFSDAAAPVIKQLLVAREMELRESESKKTKRQKAATRAHISISYEVVSCPTLAEAIHRLSDITFVGPLGLGSGVLPIFVVEDLAVPHVVPPEPLPPPVVITDEEAPVVLGEKEFEAYRIRKWNARRPHKVTAKVVVDGVEKVVNCLADAAASLTQLIDTAAASVVGSTTATAGVASSSGGDAGGGLIWVEANVNTLFSSRDSHMQRIATAVLNKTEKSKVVQTMRRVTSTEVRQLLTWGSVLQAMPHAKHHLQVAVDYSSAVEAVVEAAVAESVNSGESVDAQASAAAAAKASIPPPYPLAMHFKTLFPHSITDGQATSPKFTVVLGGDIRVDKIRALDEIVDLAGSVVLVGEFSLPFLALSGRVHLQRYTAVCEEFRAACLHIVKKARMRGVRIVLPVDLLVGDEAVRDDQKRRCYDKVEPDSRDDGADYDGETKLIHVGLEESAEVPLGLGLSEFFRAENREESTLGSASASVSASTSGTASLTVFPTVVVDRFVYDIGEKSIAALQQEVYASDLLLIWGTVGACEIAPFQAGQKSLVASAALLPPPEGETPAAYAASAAAMPTKRPFHTWVIGDSSVEWFTRMIDSDGELGGDLVEAGRLTYATRSSAVPVGILSLCPSSILDTIDRRPTSSDEWGLNERGPPVFEEEEEEEEEED